MTANLTPGISRVKVSLCLVAYSAGLLSLWLADLPELLRWALSSAVVLAGIEQWYSATNANRIKTLSYGSNYDPNYEPNYKQGHDNGWWLTFADGRVRQVTLLGDSIVLPWVVSLRFFDGQQRYSIAIFFDAVTKTQHRQLRGLLLMSPPETSAWRLAVARWYQNSIRRFSRQ